MPTELRPPLMFSLAFLLVLLLLATLSVYGFRQYERAWGMGGSWQVLTWISCGSTLLALFGALYGYGAARRRARFMTGSRALLVGSLTSIACVAVVAFAGFVPAVQSFGLWVAAVVSLIFPASAVYLFSGPANLSLNADVPHAGLRPGSGPPVS